MKPLAIVTGVGPGTGAAVARRFAEGGYRVAMLARNADRLTVLENQIPDSIAVPCDVGDAGALERPACEGAGQPCPGGGGKSRRLPSVPGGVEGARGQCQRTRIPGPGGADRHLARSIRTPASQVDTDSKAERKHHGSELATIAALVVLHTDYGCSILQRWVVASEIPDQGYKNQADTRAVGRACVEVAFHHAKKIAESILGSPRTDCDPNRKTSWFRLQQKRCAIRFPAERSRRQTESLRRNGRARR